MRCQNAVRTLSEHCQNAVRTLSERPGLCQNRCGSSTNQVERHLSPTRKRRDPVSCVLPPKLWLPTFARPNLCSADLQVLLPWLPLASPLARRDAARDESCPRAGPLASPHNHHCSEPVPGCTPCCDRRRASGSLRGSRRIWHNRIAGLSAAERAAAGRLRAYCALATPKTSPRRAHPILCC